MRRPREKKENPAFSWVVSVREIPTGCGISHPRFVWSFGGEDGIQAIELRADPFEGTFVLEDEYGRTLRFSSLEETLAKLNEHGLGKPPCIDEVFADIRAAHIRFQGGDGEIVGILEELQKRWELFKIYTNSDRLLSQI